MRLRPALVVLLLLAGVAQAGIFTGLFGSLYRNPECTFEVWFPHAPMVEHETVTTADGRTAARTRYWMLGNMYVFSVADTDYSFLPAVPADAVDAFILEIKKEGAVISSDEPVALAGISGRRLVYAFPEKTKMIVTAKFIAKNGHLFRIAEVMPRRPSSRMTADASWFEQKFKPIDGCSSKN